MPSPIDHGELCFLINKVEIPDDFGGVIVGYETGEEFYALIDIDNSVQTRIAEQNGYTSTPQVSVMKNLDINSGDLFYTDYTKEIYQVVSNPDDQLTPMSSTMDFKVFNARKTEIDGEILG